MLFLMPFLCLSWGNEYIIFTLRDNIHYVWLLHELRWQKQEWSLKQSVFKRSSCFSAEKSKAAERALLHLLCALWPWLIQDRFRGTINACGSLKCLAAWLNTGRVCMKAQYKLRETLAVFPTWPQDCTALYQPFMLLIPLWLMWYQLPPRLSALISSCCVVFRSVKLTFSSPNHRHSTELCCMQETPVVRVSASIKVTHFINSHHSKWADFLVCICFLRIYFSSLLICFRWSRLTGC